MLLLLVTSACTTLAEYELLSTGSLCALEPVAFSPISTVTGISGARSLLVYPEGILIATTEGIVYSYSLETHDLIGEFTVGAPSPAGYAQMVYSSLEETAYLIGRMGHILEITLPECTVLDEFSVCESPVILALGEGYVYNYVVDGPSNRIYMLSIENNLPYTSTSTFYNINCLEPASNSDTLLCGTSGGIHLIEALGPGSLRNTIADEPVPCYALAAIPDDTLFVGVKGYPGSYSVGVVDVLNNPSQTPPVPEYYGEVAIQGDTHFACAGTDSLHAYVLSYIGNSTSRLIAYNYHSFHIDKQMEFAGFPMGLSISEDGNIYILTGE